MVSLLPIRSDHVRLHDQQKINMRSSIEKDKEHFHAETYCFYPTTLSVRRRAISTAYIHALVLKGPSLGVCPRKSSMILGHKTHQLKRIENFCL